MFEFLQSFLSGYFHAHFVFLWSESSSFSKQAQLKNKKGKEKTQVYALKQRTISGNYIYKK